MFPVFNVKCLKEISTLVVAHKPTSLQAYKDFVPNFVHSTRQWDKCWPRRQPFMTLRDTHTKLCHFNNGVCCGFDSKTKSRPASITISFKLFPHENNTLVIMHVLAMSSGRKWLSFMSSCDVT